MPAKKPYRKQDKWANEKELAVGIGSGINDVFGRGTLAGLLGAPGDIAGMAENGIRALIGLPQVRPWGGSEHIGQKMQDYGLVSSVRRPKTELLASLISPAQIATASLKAPQYAKTALRLLDNLESAPTMRNMSQRGAIDVWHGSPHKVDKFSAMDNIGNGQGGGSFGVGGYHASSADVAKEYAPDGGYLYKNQLRWPDSAKEAKDPLSDKHFLDWDKPFDEQSDYVKSVIQGMNDDDWYRVLDNLGEDGDWSSGRNIYDMARLQFDSKEEASRRLAGVGIPGIKFNDSDTIHRLGSNTHNYVTFDDALVNILERNGQPVTAPQPGLLGKMIAPQDEALRIAQQNAAKPVSEGGLGLRPDNTPEERAAAMGFDVNTPRYHGTDKNVMAFDPAKFGEKDPGWYGRGVTTDTDPEIASGYANYYEAENGQAVYPLLTRGKFMSWPDGQPPFGSRKDAIQGTADIRALGYDGTNMTNDRDLYGSVPDIGTEQVVFDPRNIRSRFAAFDPMRRDSSDLLAGLSPLLLARPQEKEKKKK